MWWRWVVQGEEGYGRGGGGMWWRGVVQGEEGCGRYIDERRGVAEWGGGA